MSAAALAATTIDAIRIESSRQVPSYLLLLQLYLVTSLFVGVTKGQHPPRLSPLGESGELRKVVRSGTIVHLNCPVEKGDQSELFIDWIKDGESVTGIDPRIRLTSGGTLKIKQVSTEDTGFYICRAVNGFGNLEVGTTLIVLDEKLDEDYGAEYNASGNGDNSFLAKPGSRPILSEVSKFPGDRIQRPVGGSVKFKCVAGGHPRPVLTWFHNGKLLQGLHYKRKRWTLALNDLSPEDSGNYTCIAFNSNGNASATFLLEVSPQETGRKAEIVGPHPVNTTVIEGSKASLQCRVLSDSKPHIQWLKKVNRHELKNDLENRLQSGDTRNHLDSSPHILQFEGQAYIVVKEPEAILQKDGTFINRLTIPSVRFADQGEYACLGATPMGYDFKNAHLNVVPQKLSPSPPSLNQFSADESLPYNFIIVIICCLAILILPILCWIARSRKSDTFQGLRHQQPEHQHQHQQQQHHHSSHHRSSLIAPQKEGTTSSFARNPLNRENNIIYSQAPSSSYSPRLTTDGIQRGSLMADVRTSSRSPSNFSSAGLQPQTIIPCEYYHIPSEGKSYGYLC